MQTGHADMTKIKAGDLEGLNHFFDNYENVSVTEKIIFDQVKKYNAQLIRKDTFMER